MLREGKLLDPSTGSGQAAGYGAVLQAFAQRGFGLFLPHAIYY